MANDKIIGIIGGMGPAATVDLYSKIISRTSAKNDQEHFHVVIDSYPQIPDRTTFIKGEGEDPLPYILNSAERLIKCFNVSLLCMPCNTAHYFIYKIRHTVTVPFISIVESVFNDIQNYQKKFSKIGLMATDGTLIGRVYHNYFEEQNMMIHDFNKVTQQKIMESIYLVKANRINDAIEVFKSAFRDIAEQGYDLLIAGCTEIPILIPFINANNIKILDATDSLAKHVVDFFRS